MIHPNCSFFGVNAFKTLAHDDITALASPEVYPMVQRICAGYRAKPPPGMDPKLPDSVEAAFAVLTKSWKEANAIFTHAGDAAAALPLYQAAAARVADSVEAQRYVKFRVARMKLRQGVRAGQAGQTVQPRRTRPVARRPGRIQAPAGRLVARRPGR